MGPTDFDHFGLGNGRGYALRYGTGYNSYIYIYIYLDFSKPAPTQKSHSETFAGNITAVPVNYGLATRHQRESLLTFPHLNWEFG